MKVKSLEDLECVAVTTLEEHASLPFAIYLYLEQNGRIVTLIRKGDVLSKETLRQYVAKGIQSVWISKDERKIFDEYIADQKLSNAESQTSIADESDSDPSDPTKAAASAERTKREKKENPTLTRPAREARKAPLAGPAKASDDDALEARPEAAEPEALPPDAVLPPDASAPASPATKAGPSSRSTLSLSPAAEARRVLKETFNSSEKALDPENAGPTQELIEEAVRLTLPHLHELVQNIFQFQEGALGSSHGIRVSLYATLLGLAFDRTDSRSVSALAVAALFHDIGYSRSLNEDHVVSGVKCLNETLEHFPRDIADVIQSHHELFDGSGYPSRKRAFDIHPMAQILLMADTLDELVQGKHDGKERTFSEAFEAFVQMEPNPSQPSRFHPEYFRKVIRYVKETNLESTFQAVTDVIAKSTTELLDGATLPNSKQDE